MLYFGCIFYVLIHSNFKSQLGNFFRFGVEFVVFSSRCVWDDYVYFQTSVTSFIKSRFCLKILRIVLKRRHEKSFHKSLPLFGSQCIRLLAQRPPVDHHRFIRLQRCIVGHLRAQNRRVRSGRALEARCCRCGDGGGGGRRLRVAARRRFAV